MAYKKKYPDHIDVQCPICGNVVRMYRQGKSAMTYSNIVDGQRKTIPCTCAEIVKK